MRFLADECVYRSTSEVLRQWGHDVITVQEIQLVGESDWVVLGRAIREGRVLITNDMHFSNILVFPPHTHLGIIVLKIRPSIISEVHLVLSRFLSTTSQEEMKGTLVMINRNKYRLRRA